MPCLSRKAPLFYGGSPLPCGAVLTKACSWAQAALVRVDQHIPHLLALGRALLQHQMVLLQCPAGHGRCPHVGRGQPLQDRDWLHRSYTWMRRSGLTCQRTPSPPSSPGSWKSSWRISIYLSSSDRSRYRLPGQRAVPVGQQTVFKIHNGFHFQAPPGAVMGIVLVILHGVPQQSQMIPLPQDMIQCSMEPPSRMWMWSR